MNKLNLIANEINHCIENLCEKFQLTLKGNVYIHTEQEEITFQFSQNKDKGNGRKLGGFYDTLLEKTACPPASPYNKFTDYFAHMCTRPDIRESTRKAYKRTHDTLQEYAPHAEFRDIDRHYIKGYEQYLISLDMKNNTVLKNLKHLKKAINSAGTQGYIKTTAKELFSECSIRPEKCHKESLNHSEVLQLHEYLTGNFHTLPERDREVLAGFLFSCYTVLRYSDLHEVRYSDFRRLKNKRWLILTMQKSGHKVMIPVEQLFNGRALQIARLFHRTRGRLFYLPSNAICNRIIKRTYHNVLCGKKPISFHTARHTAATLLLYYNLPLTTVQYILGHTSIRTTEIYAEVNEATIHNSLRGIRFKGF